MAPRYSSEPLGQRDRAGARRRHTPYHQRLSTQRIHLAIQQQMGWWRAFTLATTQQSMRNVGRNILLH